MSDEKRFHDTVSSNGTFLGVRTSAEISHPTLDKIFAMMIERGWTIENDKKVDQIIQKYYFQGKKGDLYFRSHKYPAGFELEFYQEINIINKNGGYYDFDKLTKMPYVIRCQFLIESKYIKQLLIQEGYEDTSELNFKYAIDKVMYKIKSCWHYEEGKELPEYEIPSYNSKDKNDKQIRNGQTKYFYDYKWRLKRGTVYHNINNMWWVILNKFEFTNVAAFHLFDVEAENFPKKRIQNKEIPQRIRVEKLREKFKALGFSYKQLNEEHIYQLRTLLTIEFDVFDSDLKLKLSTQRKKDIKVLKRTGLQYAIIQVDGYYFSRREAITFSSSGFIGFAGWASDYNVTPFISAFEKWLEWLCKTVKVAA